jgi:hypothetical protein
MERGMIMIKTSIASVVKKEDFLYMVSSDANIILKMNLISEKFEVVGSVPEEAKSKEGLFSKILAWKDYFIFVPHSAHSLWISDADFKNWKKFELKERDKDMKFCCAVIIDDILYMPKHFYPVSLCVDLNTFTMSEMQNMSDEQFLSAYKIGDCIYCPSRTKNKLIIYDTKVKKFSEVIVGENGKTYNYMLQDGERIFLTPRAGTDVVILKDNKEIDRICLGEELELKNIFYFDKALYMPSLYRGKSLKLTDGRLEKIDLGGCYSSWEIDDGLQCVTDDRAYLYLFDCKHNTVKKINVEVEYDDIEENVGNDVFCEPGSSCYEGVFRKLDTFMQVI